MRNRGNRGRIAVLRRGGCRVSPKEDPKEVDRRRGAIWGESEKGEGRRRSST